MAGVKAIPGRIVYRGHQYGRYPLESYDTKEGAAKEQAKLKKQGVLSILRKFHWVTGSVNKMVFDFYIIYVRRDQVPLKDRGRD